MAPATKPEVVSPAVDLPEGTSAVDQKAHKSAYNRQAAYFKTQPKVRIRVLEETFVQVNGYGFRIAAKEWVDVPEDIANLLAEAGRI